MNEVLVQSTAKVRIITEEISRKVILMIKKTPFTTKAVTTDETLIESRGAQVTTVIFQLKKKITNTTSCKYSLKHF